jgi:hypothetical protein
VFAAIKRWFQNNPRIVFLVIVGAVLLGLFLGVVTPLFATAGPAMADISGALPATATAGKRLEIDVSLDNVGDPVTGGNGSWTVCGGELTSQSSAPVQLFFDAGSAGTVLLVLSPKNGKQVIGQALNGSLSVQNP